MLPGVASLGVAQALALLAVAASGAVYAHWLDAATLAAWALALSAARAALLLVDAGLKTALVRRGSALSHGAERHLQRQLALAALLLTSLLGGATLGASWAGWMAGASAGLMAASMAAYLGGHVALLPGLVRLERQGRFAAVGRAEGLGTLVEFAAPAVLLMLGLDAMPALTLGVVAGRLLRAMVVARSARGPHPETAGGPGDDAVALLCESLPLHGVALLSMARDTVHLWLLGPWFGAAWAGAYAFALMAVMVASQIVVGAVARAALPALRPLSPRRRLLQAARTLRLLAWVVLPLLALPMPLLAAADTLWLQGRWHDAVQVLPWLVLRVAVALPLAVFGPWLLVAAPPEVALRVHLRWTLGEVAVAALLLAVAGPLGLAWAWAAGALLGLGLYAEALRAAGVDMARLTAAVLRRRPRRGCAALAFSAG